MQSDGTLIVRQPGPTDQRVTAAGTWKLTGEKLELSAQGEPVQILCIESIEPDRLVVRKISTCQSE